MKLGYNYWLNLLFQNIILKMEIIIKKFLFICLDIFVCLLIYYAFFYNISPQYDIKNIKNYDFYNKLGFYESNISNKRYLDKQSLTDLFGTPVTNELGIPDVYLDLVHNDIPESHEKARLSAVKMFYFDSLAMQALHNKNYNEFLSNTYRWSAGVKCFFLYEKNNEKLKYDFIDQKIKTYNSIPKLKKLNQQSDNNLGGHAINDDYGLDYNGVNMFGKNSGYMYLHSESEICDIYLNKKF